MLAEREDWRQVDVATTYLATQGRDLHERERPIVPPCPLFRAAPLVPPTPTNQMP